MVWVPKETSNLNTRWTFWETQSSFYTQRRLFFSSTTIELLSCCLAFLKGFEVEILNTTMLWPKNYFSFVGSGKGKLKSFEEWSINRKELQNVGPPGGKASLP